MSQLLQVAIRSGAVSADGTTAPDSFSQGIPFAAGAIAIDSTSAIASYSQGLPMTAAGRIATTTDAPASWVSGTMPINAAGRLCMVSGAVDSYVTGIPFTATGQVAVASSASRFLFNGVNQYVSFLPWTPTEINYTISVYTHWIAQAGAGSSNMIVGQEALTTAIYVNTATNVYTARNLLDPSGNMFLTTAVQAAPATVQHILEVIGSASQYSVTGGTAPPDNRQTLPLAEITRIGGRSASAYFNGYIYDVKLTDHADPGNSRWYKMDDGAGDTIKCYEENGDLKPDNTLDGTIVGFVDNSAWS